MAVGKTSGSRKPVISTRSWTPRSRANAASSNSAATSPTTSAWTCSIPGSARMRSSTSRPLDRGLEAEGADQDGRSGNAGLPAARRPPAPRSAARAPASASEPGASAARGPRQTPPSSSSRNRRPQSLWVSRPRCRSSRDRFAGISNSRRPAVAAPADRQRRRGALPAVFRAQPADVGVEIARRERRLDQQVVQAQVVHGHHARRLQGEPADALVVDVVAHLVEGQGGWPGPARRASIVRYPLSTSGAASSPGRRTMRRSHRGASSSSRSTL